MSLGPRRCDVATQSDSKPKSLISRAVVQRMVFQGLYAVQRTIFECSCSTLLEEQTVIMVTLYTRPTRLRRNAEPYTSSTRSRRRHAIEVVKHIANAMYLYQVQPAASKATLHDRSHAPGTSRPIGTAVVSSSAYRAAASSALQRWPPDKVATGD